MRPPSAKRTHRFIARKDDKPVAAIIEATAPDAGYSGAIQLIVGADFNGTVRGRV